MAKFQTISPAGKSLSDGTKKVYTSHLNKMAAKGWDTPAALIAHQKECVEFIESLATKQAKIQSFAAVFWQLHDYPLKDKLKYYNASQMMKDEPYRKFIEEAPVEKKEMPAEVPKNEVVAPKPKRAIKVKKAPAEPAPKPSTAKEDEKAKNKKTIEWLKEQMKVGAQDDLKHAVEMLEHHMAQVNKYLAEVARLTK